jgi:flagellar export protein FliJ
MGYRFRFKTLSQYREFLLKKEQIGLAQALRKLEDNLAERAGMQEQLRKAATSWEKRQCEGMGVPEFLAYGERIHSLEQQLLKLEIERLRIQKEVDAAKHHVLEKERDLKALNILEEQERESYRYDVKKKEQGDIDEFAILGKGRKSDDPGSS